MTTIQKEIKNFALDDLMLLRPNKDDDYQLIENADVLPDGFELKEECKSFNMNKINHYLLESFYRLERLVNICLDLEIKGTNYE